MGLARWLNGRPLDLEFRSAPSPDHPPGNFQHTGLRLFPVGLEFLIQTLNGPSVALPRTVPLPYTPQHEHDFFASLPPS